MRGIKGLHAVGVAGGGHAAVAGRSRPAQGAAGFTLIEVLITVFVTAVGLLSVAGLQGISKKVSYDAVQRTSATALAQSIVQHMRANPAQRAAYVTADATTLSKGTDCGAADANCSTAQVAAYDLYTWGQLLLGTEVIDDSGAATGGLITPAGCISLDAGSGMYVVTIAWRGISPLPPPDASSPADAPERSSCGANKAEYDDPDSSGNDARMRRVQQLRVFITDPYAL